MRHAERLLSCDGDRAIRAILDNTVAPVGHVFASLVYEDDQCSALVVIIRNHKRIRVRSGAR